MSPLDPIWTRESSRSSTTSWSPRTQAGLSFGLIAATGALITAGVAATMLGQPEIGAPLIAMSVF